MTALHDTELRHTPRQRELIAVASRLFAARGYHAVGINDISGDLGLTGPAFYRHFKSKEALLIAVLNSAISRHLEEVGDLVATIADPDDTLDAIIRHHIDFVFDETENIVLWRTEFRNLPDEDRHRLRYLQRLYTEEWVRALRRLRPELPVDLVRSMCHGAIGLVQSPTEYSTALSRDELAPVLLEMARAALLGSSEATVTSAGARPRASKVRSA